MALMEYAPAVLLLSLKSTIIDHNITSSRAVEKFVICLSCKKIALNMKIINFKKHGGIHVPISTNGAKVEMCERFKFLGVNFTNHMSWTNHIDATTKKAYQCL